MQSDTSQPTVLEPSVPTDALTLAWPTEARDESLGASEAEPPSASDYGRLPEPDPEFAVGGQAVLEGVMMRGPRSYAVAVRRAQGGIVLLSRSFVPIAKRRRILGLPVLRGAVSLVEMLFLGYRTLEYSAGIAERSARAEDAARAAQAAPAAARTPTIAATPADVAAESVSGAATLLSSDAAVAQDVSGGAPFPATDAPAASSPPAPPALPDSKPGGLSGWTMLGVFLASMAFAMSLFVVLPNVSTVFITKLFTPGGYLEQDRPIAYNLIAGFVRILVIVAYIWAISLLKDIRRLFQYHGAEHKVVMAYEQHIPLELEHLRGVTTIHPRCGTTFVAIVLFVSIIAFAFLAALLKMTYPQFGHWPFVAQKAAIIALHILFMPLVAGLAFEITRRAGRRPGFWPYRLLLLPGYAFQRITTREPDDSMIEVSLAAFREALVPLRLDRDPA